MKTENVLGRPVVLTLLVSLAFVMAFSIAPVTFAATSPTPNGFAGACNMLQSWGVGAQGGMANAMTVNSPNGDAGMFHAVVVSGC